jgi:hypothetical protein
MAATNKHLARSNKSRTGAEAIRKRLKALEIGSLMSIKNTATRMKVIANVHTLAMKQTRRRNIRDRYEDVIATMRFLVGRIERQVAEMERERSA